MSSGRLVKSVTKNWRPKSGELVVEQMSDC